MSYRVEKKISGNIYLYEITSYWDKDKKETKKKQKYLGPKFPKRAKSIDNDKIPILEYTKNFGNYLLYDHIVKEIGLDKILKKTFPDCYQEILSLAYYQIDTGDALHLFPTWYNDNYSYDCNRLTSKEISQLTKQIGLAKDQVSNFFAFWIKKHHKQENVYYDITSFSSYSDNIEWIEWGYNLDNEKLPQLNMGLVCSQNTSLPLFYRIHPGSIPDVVTLKNTTKYLKIYGLEDILFIMDKGFYSEKNLLKLAKDGIDFIMPASFSSKQTVNLAKNSKRSLKDTSSAFIYSDEILYYKKSIMKFDNKEFDAHIFRNDQKERDAELTFLKKLLKIEQEVASIEFPGVKEATAYRNDNCAGYGRFFSWNRATKKLEQNIRQIKSYLANKGICIILTNRNNLDKEFVLDSYRNKDKVEKLFDKAKNDLDCKRLRTHGQITTEGKLFVKFITLIVDSVIANTMREKKLFAKFTVKELIAELRKLKLIHFKGHKPLLNEITKKQKAIFQDFGIDWNKIMVPK